MRDAIVCKRLNFTLPEPPTLDVQTFLMTQRLTFVKEAPAIVCVANDGLFPGSRGDVRIGLRSWCAVKEVHLGTTEQEQDKVVSLKLTFDRLGDPEALQDGYAWHTTMPADAKELYAKFVFRDGEVSRPLLLTIEDVDLPQSGGRARRRGQ